MEIVGLLVIVIIIVLIIFFSLTFRLRQPGTERTLTYQDENIVKQLGPTITETTTQCGNNQRILKELITDCATTKSINCGTQTSCEKLNQTISKIIDETTALDLSYELTIPDTNNQHLITNFTQRLNSNARNSQLFITPIPSSRGSTALRIRVFY